MDCEVVNGVSRCRPRAGDAAGTDPTLALSMNRWPVPGWEVTGEPSVTFELSFEPIQASQTMCLMSKESFYFPPPKGLLAKQPPLGTCLFTKASHLLGNSGGWHVLVAVE